MDNSDQQIIQNNSIDVPGWVLYTLLQHLEVSWDSKTLTIPQSEVTINSYRLGSRLLREMIDSKKNEISRTTVADGETVEEVVQEKPKKKRNKPKN